jgi:hypothetical protein
LLTASILSFQGGGDTVGTQSFPISVDPKTAKRVSAYTAYLEPVLERSNLLVLVEATVRKVSERI